MVQLSETILTAINQTAKALIDHVATAGQVLLADHSRIREWLHEFGYAVAKYLGVVRIIAAETGLPYANPDQVTEALRSGDEFLLRHVHWTWDEAWLDNRWRQAALERKRVWEEEQQLLHRKQEEEKEKEILSKVQAFLDTEIRVSDYPTEEEWAALCAETSTEDIIIDLFDPNNFSISSDVSLSLNPHTSSLSSNMPNAQLLEPYQSSQLPMESTPDSGGIPLNDTSSSDDNNSDSSDDEVFLRLGGGTLIGTGQRNAPACSACSKGNIKCFRLNRQNTCGHCYQEHIECRFPKSNGKSAIL
ncbi:hypothetical protein BDP27DRAFT_1430626 [Rhodocollybia butyracea]|uniref:Zn(2)-C6 fungal-type domain-containing protein n=1 Tax=Rhodocollybia butyracea TaxID=206335 RepID=A0A9P5PAU6_9AGAR|nr:hypothetical protein BDP27DRAFT_1430626 [Rhodocollybia butyracea]